jgi:sulfate adenylyltransferase subunit 1 (EFTu-like GTPase family)
LTRTPFAVCSLGAVLAGAGCGTQKLDIADAERTMGKQLTAEQGQKVKVDCPDEVEIKRGDTFVCKATGGKKARTVRVTQLNDKGRVRWVVTGAR